MHDCFHKLFDRKCVYSFLDSYTISANQESELQFEKETRSFKILQVEILSSTQTFSMSFQFYFI